MNIDALKQGLAALDQRLDEEIPLDAATLAQRARGRVRRSLLPLAGGQIVQGLVGGLVTVLGVTAWRSDLAHPGALFASGLLVHAYGILMIAFAVATWVHVSRINEAGPLLEMQARVTRLRRLTLVSGYLLGASWWLLWLPFAVVLVKVVSGVNVFEFGFDLGLWGWITLITSIGGYVGMWLFHRWAHRNGRERLAARLDDILTGAGVRDAQRWMNEIASFTRD